MPHPLLLRNPRVLLAGFGLLAAGLAAYSLRVFSRYPPTAALAGGGVLSGAGQFALQADTVEVVGRGGGRVRWRMQAGSVSLSRDRRTLSAAGIRRGVLYTAAGKPGVVVSADTAGFQTPFGSLGPGSAGTLTVAGHVAAQAQSAAHPLLRTEQLRWDSGTDTFVCPQTVRAALPKLSVTAGNASYSAPGALDAGTLRLGGGVQARVSTPRGLFKLSCPGLLWTAAGQSARTLGPVTALIPGGLGAATAADVSVSTRTGDVTGHGFRGTLRLSSEVH